MRIASFNGVVSPDPYRVRSVSDDLLQRMVSSGVMTVQVTAYPDLRADPESGYVACSRELIKSDNQQSYRERSL
jgi:hypothetical protein